MKVFAATSNHRFLFACLALAAVVAACTGLSYSSASAATSYAYNDANLISDSVFADSNTMSTSVIQDFLQSKHSGLASYKDVENCGSTTGAHYDYYNTYYDCGKSVSAAQIIHDAAHAYKINPQALLATMQKEQSLVTTPDPTASQVDCAMGYYSCGGGFDTFFSQVDNGAWQFRVDIELMSGNNYWGYTPSSYPCNSAGYTNAYNSSGKMVSTRLYSTGLYPGAKVTFDDPNIYSSTGKLLLDGTPETITLANHATAALHCYTPYVGPMSKTGYSGSYNFVQSFEQWFGPTAAKDYYQFERLAGPRPAKFTSSSSSLGNYTSTVTLDNKIYAFYYDATNKNLHYAYWNGSTWSNNTLDGVGSSVQGATSDDVGQGVVTGLWNGEIQVYYYDETSGDLRHAWTSSTGWRLETLDGTSSSHGGDNADVGQNPTVGVWNGQLQVYYYDATNGNLRHGWTVHGFWHFETLDGTSSSHGGDNADVGNQPVTLNFQGDLFVFYYDATNSAWRVAYYDNSWHFFNLDGSADDSDSLSGSSTAVGGQLSAAIWQNDSLQIYYQDSGGGLAHAWANR